MSHSDSKLKEEVAGALRQVRDQARAETAPGWKLPSYEMAGEPRSRLAPLPETPSPEGLVSPDRTLLNERWDVSAALEMSPRSRLGRLLWPMRGPIRRLFGFALGRFVERAVDFNSAQVRFDNDIVRYLDERADRITAHYDRVLGAHGKRMEEIDERHLILQQELIRHVHDLVKRIEFVFESAEQNHLYLEGYLREVREEVQTLAARLGAPLPPGGAPEEPLR